jgi:broad specificity phosphatase PhoE
MDATWSVNDPAWDDIPPGMNGKILREYVFFRHAESRSNADLMGGKGAGSHGNSVLTPRGKRQAKAVQVIIKKMIDSDPDNTDVWVSPLVRAKETIGDVVPHYINTALHEKNTTPEGEHIKEDEERFKQRVAWAISILLRGSEGSRGVRHRVIIVGHSLFINELVCQMVGDKNITGFFHFTNGSITTICQTTAGTELTMLGGVYHLTPDDRTGGHTNLLKLMPATNDVHLSLSCDYSDLRWLFMVSVVMVGILGYQYTTCE